MKEKNFFLVVPLYMSYTLFFDGLCEQLARQGWQVWVFTKLPRNFEAPDGKIQFVNLDMPRRLEVFKYLKCAKKLRGFIKRIRPSIIHAHFQPAALVVRLTGANKKAITLTTSHGLIFNTIGNKLKSKFFKFIEVNTYRGFRKLWVLTKCDESAVKKYVPQAEAYPTKGVGCNLQRFDHTKFDKTFKEKIRQKLGIPESDFVFVFSGRMTNFKGFDVVYRAFKKVNAKHPHTKLLVLGDLDPNHPSGLTNEEIYDLGNSKQIAHVGFIPDVENYLCIADVLVFPSNREGMPVNLMEAISMGVPVLTLNSRGCADVVGTKYGLVLNKKSPEKFAEAMEQLFLDKEMWCNIRKQQLEDRDLFGRHLFIQHQIGQYELFLKDQT